MKDKLKPCPFCNKDKVAESLGIKKYIRYVKQRVRIVRLDCAICSDNQISYFDSLNRAINEYESTHKIYIKYLIGKLNFNEVKNILGEPDRQVLRYLERQRKLLIDYLQEKEIEYFAKYPFEDEITINTKVDYER
jgi:transcription elongation factor Elf1